ncbi:UDP-galactose transporter [Colletotrichum camelliae]|nr:UDP-galactose transporter [Colletotrichum camelliae]
MTSTKLVIQNSLSLILLHKIQQPSLDDRNRYEPLTTVILSEALKLAICVAVLGFDKAPELGRTNKIQLITDNLRDGHLKAAAPAVLYTIATVLQSLGARNLDGMSFVILSQLKLILTPIFSVVILRQSLTVLQWVCLFAIGAGIVLVQTTASSTATFDSKYGQDLRLGAISMLISGTCVTLAGILMESILKGPNRFFVRNSQLAAYACLCAGLSLLTRFATTVKGPVSNEIASFFKGYHVLVWAFVLLQAAVGFMIASIGPSLLSPHITSLRTLTGVGFVTTGVLGSLGDYRKPMNAVSGADTDRDIEKSTLHTREQLDDTENLSLVDDNDDGTSGILDVFLEIQEYSQRDSYEKPVLEAVCPEETLIALRRGDRAYPGAIVAWLDERNRDRGPRMTSGLVTGFQSYQSLKLKRPCADFTIIGKRFGEHGSPDIDIRKIYIPNPGPEAVAALILTAPKTFASVLRDFLWKYFSAQRSFKVTIEASPYFWMERNPIDLTTVID